ncbi:30S ribosomal protein S13, partial [Tetrabaena socialis]
VKDIKDSYLRKVASYLEANFTTGDALKREVRNRVLSQVAIGSRRGVRHTLGLPVSSASTRSNAVNARKLQPLLMYDTSRR